jgi:hypothetical protein
MAGAAQQTDGAMGRELPERRRPARPRAKSLMGRDARRRLLALTALLAGAWLAAQAWPRLQASVLFLPVDTAIGRYFDSREIPSAQLEALIAQTKRAIERRPHYRYYNGLSFLHYLRALDPTVSSSERRLALQASIAAAEQALARAPAKPATWLRVAQARAALGEGEAAVLPPLEMSILTGRVEPSLLLPRLELGLRYLPRLDAESNALLRDQLLLTWRVNDSGVLQALREGRLKLDQVRAVLGPAHADVWEEMELGLQLRGRKR